MDMNDVMSSNQVPISFEMVEDNSPGFARFANMIEGFPTYILEKIDGTLEELSGHDRSSQSIVQLLSSKTV